MGYGLALERVAPPSPSAPVIPYGTTRSDGLDPVGDVDLFAFDGTTGDTVVVQASRLNGGHPCVELFRPDGTRLGSHCPYNSSSARIDAALDQTGPYTILVSEWANDQTMGYGLALQCVSGPCVAPPPTTGSLTVTVRRSDTNALLSGALVTAASPGTLQAQTTGSSGTTTFSTLQAGSYSLTVSLTGFQTGSTPATVSANTTSSVTILLTSITTTGSWSGWSAVPGGGQTGSQPAAVIDSTGVLRLYIQGIDNGLWVKQKSGGLWSDWSRVPGGGSLDGPTAFLDGSAVRLVVRGLDNSLWTALADTPTWTHLGGRSERSPAALLHAGSPSIFIRGLDGRLYETLRDQTGVWSQWAEVPGGGQSSGQPAAVVDSTGTLHLYLQGIDNSLWTNQVSPTLAWGQWTVAAVGRRATVGPAAILDGDRMRLVVRGLDNQIWTTLSSDSQASQWGNDTSQSLGTMILIDKRYSKGIVFIHGI